MDRDDLLLRLLCAVTILEREGGVETIEALNDLYSDLAACDGTLSSDPMINDIRLSVATLSYTLTVQ